MNDSTKTAGNLKSTMDRISPAGWEIKLGGPREFVVTTPEALHPSARESVEAHFSLGAKIRYQVGVLS